MGVFLMMLGTICAKKFQNGVPGLMAAFCTKV
jgi:hypothetical protein